MNHVKLKDFIKTLDGNLWTEPITKLHKNDVFQNTNKDLWYIISIIKCRSECRFTCFLPLWCYWFEYTFPLFLKRNVHLFANSCKNNRELETVMRKNDAGWWSNVNMEQFFIGKKKLRFVFVVRFLGINLIIVII